jgi:transcriptional regulator with XRE-family HTH domain
MTKFKELLLSRYKNQVEAANDLGFSTATISEWVNGGKKPSFANAKKTSFGHG